MDKIAVITLILGAVGGYLIGSHGQEAVDEHEGHAHDGASVHSTHEIRNVEGVVPGVDLVVYDDPMGGYIAQVLLTNYTFAPESVSTEAVDGEGHAHLYIDGEKVNRVLGEWYNIGKLPEGEHEIAVRLSSNDHHELAVDDQVITDTETVTVLEGDDEMHMDHEDSMMEDE